MCQKRQRRCAVNLAYREEAYREWARAETLHEVRAAWGDWAGGVRCIATAAPTSHGSRGGPNHDQGEASARSEIWKPGSIFQTSVRLTNQEETK
jgi:hypothetical protein